MGIENITVNRGRIQEVITCALEARQDRTHLFSQEILAPEKEFVDLIKAYSVLERDERFAANALFLTTSLVFAEDTAAFFKRISDPELFSKYSWLFIPEIVLITLEVEDSCKKYFRPGGYSQIALNQWQHNCRLMVEKYGGDIRNFFKENDNDAVKIVNALVVYPRKKDKEGFRRFGPKLARLIVQWVKQYDLYPLSNTEKVGVPIDFQVARLLVQTNGLTFENPVRQNDVAVKILTPLLVTLCEENGWDPKDVSETLWFIGNMGCNERRHQDCPLDDKCTSLLSRTLYDSKGLIDPTDIGRFKMR